jgi:hypothetical protein
MSPAPDSVQEAFIEVHGGSIGAIIDCFKFFPGIAIRYLLKYGICTAGPNNEPVVDRQAWHPQRSWLAAHKAIANEVGAEASFNIGVAVPKNASWPPDVKDVDAAIASIDIAYHLNHRKDGVVMYDPATATMLEGIGHYGYARDPDEQKIVSVCDNPYPCDFDQGLLLGMASRFSSRARVVHVEGSCRKHGDPSCTYIITW